VDGSHVHDSSIGQGDAQLYSGSIATPTPQAFSVASPPAFKPGYGVDDPRLTAGRRHALHPGPYPPDLSRCEGLRSFDHWFTCVTPSDLARRARAVW
jgi:hypothetical protein